MAKTMRSWTVLAIFTVEQGVKVEVVAATAEAAEKIARDIPYEEFTIQYSKPENLEIENVF